MSEITDDQAALLGGSRNNTGSTDFVNDFELSSIENASHQSQTIVNEKTTSNTYQEIEDDDFEDSGITRLERLDKEIVIQDDDLENVKLLKDWLVETVEIVPSLAKIYAKILVKENIGTIRRLFKRVEKDPEFLESLGISRDDAEEIASNLFRYE